LHESSVADIDEARTSAAIVGDAVALGIQRKRVSSHERRGIEPYSANVKTVNSAAFETVNQETGEVLQVIESRGRFDLKPASDPGAKRLERFALQSAVSRLLPHSCTAKCLRFRQSGKDAEVWKSSEHGTAHYGGLVSCASVWACPVCAAKISERRKAEVFKAMEAHKANGGEVLLLTLTNPHTVGDDLQAMLAAQSVATKRLYSGRSARALWASIGCVGTIRAWEVTYGDNGWHPHFHILLFVRAGLDLAALRADFYREWSNACRLAKLPTPSEAHGVRLDDGSKAGEYAAKGVWGLEHEMTKGHIKKAKKGRSPFDLLRSYLYDKDKQAGALFVHYAKAFHGKKQLQWSRGLKTLFSINDRTDAETAAVIEDDAALLGRIEPEEWLLVLKFEVRGDVLELATLGGWEPVRRLLDSLLAEEQRRRRKTRPKGRGRIYG